MTRIMVRPSEECRRGRRLCLVWDLLAAVGTLWFGGAVGRVVVNQGQRCHGNTPRLVT